MIKNFINAWNENKTNLENYFKTYGTETIYDYKDILKLMLELVINPYLGKKTKRDIRPLDIDNITKIDDGDYQGTLVYVIPEKTYQPDITEYIVTYVYYGSCSGCDTLESIFADKNKKSQVEDLMKLALDILQSMYFLKESHKILDLSTEKVELNNTVELMKSNDYKDRFLAEYLQTKIRYDKLNEMLKKYANGNLDFTPSCPIELLQEQKEYMESYLTILRTRAEIEDIDLYGIIFV